MIKLRSLSPNDILLLDQLWQEHWSDTSLPGIRNRIIDSIAYDSQTKRIIGYGQVKLFAEAMLFLDPTTTKRARVEALKLLMSEAFRGVDMAKIEEIYAFVKDPDFSLLIQKRYGFNPVIQPGEMLIRRM
jgi:hypothetical protein